MIPDMSSVLNGWAAPTEMKVIKTTAVDFEAVETAEAVRVCEMLLSPMPAQKIDRKPEGERDWMWWSGLSTTKLKLDDEIQDDENRVFKVSKRVDWGKAGFYEYDLVEKPT